LKFSELVRLLEAHGFSLVKEKGSIRYYGKGGWPALIRIDYHGAKEVPTGTCYHILKSAGIKKEIVMIDLPYSLIIEATKEPDYFGFFSPELEGFTGIGHSIEDCVYKAKWGMKEHVELLKEQGLPVPPVVKNPKIIVQNEDRLAA
jgi:predicted RNA binding protein YcfA (HicA-like mRNA interferase family)/predicted RNase H-like HicB family nuclease